MQTIEPKVGQHISEVARLLVANAPARTVFNDIPVRAKYATTNPADVVREYEWRSELRRIVYVNSAKGRAAKAREVAHAERLRPEWAACEADLQTLDLADAAAVLAWVERAAPLTDRVDVDCDREALAEHFRRGGWLPGANTDSDFRGDDAQNFAEWIVGQWLVGYPYVGPHIAKWRQRFAGGSSPA